MGAYAICYTWRLGFLIRPRRVKAPNPVWLMGISIWVKLRITSGEMGLVVYQLLLNSSNLVNPIAIKTLLI